MIEKYFIYTSCIVSGTRSIATSSRNKEIFEFLSLNKDIEVANEALNNRNTPFPVNVELVEVLIKVTIPLESGFSLTVSSSFDFGKGQIISV